MDFPRMFNLKSGEPCGCVGKSLRFQSCTSYIKSMNLRRHSMYLNQTKQGNKNWSHPPWWITASLANLVNCTTKRPPFLVQNTLQILSGAIFQRRISHVQMHLEPLLVQGWWMPKSEFSDVPHPPKSLSKSPMPEITKHYPCSSQHRCCLLIYRFFTKWFSSLIL